MHRHRDFFNQRAKHWDSRKSPQEFEKVKEILDMLCIEKGESILDAGCGTGILFPLLLEKIGSCGKVTGIDISKKMILCARKKFPSKAQCIEAPAEDIPVEENTFNRVICYSSFPHFKNKKKAFSEFARVLKKNGWVHIIHSSPRSHINSLHAGIGGPVEKDLIPSADIVTKLFKDAGYSSIEINDKKSYYLASGCLNLK
ncbi:MAG: class I SAM-dependent methyltransferase [Elusimicrobiota bacterium]